MTRSTFFPLRSPASVLIFISTLLLARSASTIYCHSPGYPEPSHGMQQYPIPDEDCFSIVAEFYDDYPKEGASGGGHDTHLNDNTRYHWVTGRNRWPVTLRGKFFADWSIEYPFRWVLSSITRLTTSTQEVVLTPAQIKAAMRDICVRCVQQKAEGFKYGGVNVVNGDGGKMVINFEGVTWKDEAGSNTTSIGKLQKVASLIAEKT